MLMRHNCESISKLRNKDINLIWITFAKNQTEQEEDTVREACLLFRHVPGTTIEEQNRELKNKTNNLLLLTLLLFLPHLIKFCLKNLYNTAWASNGKGRLRILILILLLLLFRVFLISFSHILSFLKFLPTLRIHGKSIFHSQGSLQKLLVWFVLCTRLVTQFDYINPRLAVLVDFWLARAFHGRKEGNFQ